MPINVIENIKTIGKLLKIHTLNLDFKKISNNHKSQLSINNYPPFLHNLNFFISTHFKEKFTNIEILFILHNTFYSYLANNCNHISLASAVDK